MGKIMQSNTSNSYKKLLFSKLKDKEYRQAFVEAYINNGIPFQIRTMRNTREMKQEDLGRLAGMKQEAICRLENPNYGSFTLKTLKDLASAFDVALMVKFVPFSELAKWDLNLSATSLDVPSYDEDYYFQESDGEEVVESGESQRYKIAITQVVSDKVVRLEDYKTAKTNHSSVYQPIKAVAS